MAHDSSTSDELGMSQVGASLLFSFQGSPNETSQAPTASSLSEEQPSPAEDKPTHRDKELAQHVLGVPASPASDPDERESPDGRPMGVDELSATPQRKMLADDLPFSLSGEESSPEQRDSGSPSFTRTPGSATETEDDGGQFSRTKVASAVRFRQEVPSSALGDQLHDADADFSGGGDFEEAFEEDLAEAEQSIVRALAETASTGRSGASHLTQPMADEPMRVAGHVAFKDVPSRPSTEQPSRPSTERRSLDAPATPHTAKAVAAFDRALDMLEPSPDATPRSRIPTGDTTLNSTVDKSRGGGEPVPVSDEKRDIWDWDVSTGLGRASLESGTTNGASSSYVQGDAARHMLEEAGRDAADERRFQISDKELDGMPTPSSHPSDASVSLGTSTVEAARRFQSRSSSPAWGSRPQSGGTELFADARTLPTSQLFENLRASRASQLPEPKTLSTPEVVKGFRHSTATFETPALDYLRSKWQHVLEGKKPASETVPSASAEDEANVAASMTVPSATAEDETKVAHSPGQSTDSPPSTGGVQAPGPYRAARREPRSPHRAAVQRIYPQVALGVPSRRDVAPPSLPPSTAGDGSFRSMVHVEVQVAASASSPSLSAAPGAAASCDVPLRLRVGVSQRNRLAKLPVGASLRIALAWHVRVASDQGSGFDDVARWLKVTPTHQEFSVPVAEVLEQGIMAAESSCSLALTPPPLARSTREVRLQAVALTSVQLEEEAPGPARDYQMDGFVLPILVTVIQGVAVPRDRVMPAPAQHDEVVFTRSIAPPQPTPPLLIAGTGGKAGAVPMAPALPHPARSSPPRRTRLAPRVGTVPSDRSASMSRAVPHQSASPARSTRSSTTRRPVVESAESRCHKWVKRSIEAHVSIAPHSDLVRVLDSDSTVLIGPVPAGHDAQFMPTMSVRLPPSERGELGGHRARRVMVEVSYSVEQAAKGKHKQVARAWRKLVNEDEGADLSALRASVWVERAVDVATLSPPGDAWAASLATAARATPSSAAGDLFHLRCTVTVHVLLEPRAAAEARRRARQLGLPQPRTPPRGGHHESRGVPTAEGQWVVVPDAATCSAWLFVVGGQSRTEFKVVGPSSSVPLLSPSSPDLRKVVPHSIVADTVVVDAWNHGDRTAMIVLTSAPVSHAKTTDGSFDTRILRASSHPQLLTQSDGSKSWAVIAPGRRARLRVRVSDAGTSLLSAWSTDAWLGVLWRAVLVHSKRSAGACTAEASWPQATKGLAPAALSTGCWKALSLATASAISNTALRSLEAQVGKASLADAIAGPMTDAVPWAILRTAQTGWIPIVMEMERDVSDHDSVPAHHDASDHDSVPVHHDDPAVRSLWTTPERSMVDSQAPTLPGADYSTDEEDRRQPSPLSASPARSLQLDTSLDRSIAAPPTPPEPRLSASGTRAVAKEEPSRHERPVPPSAPGGLANRRQREIHQPPPSAPGGLLSQRPSGADLVRRLVNVGGQRAPRRAPPSLPRPTHRLGPPRRVLASEQDQEPSSPRGATSSPSQLLTDPGERLSDILSPPPLPPREDPSWMSESALSPPPDDSVVSPPRKTAVDVEKELSKCFVAPSTADVTLELMSVFAQTSVTLRNRGSCPVEVLIHQVASKSGLIAEPAQVTLAPLSDAAVTLQLPPTDPSSLAETMRSAVPADGDSSAVVIGREGLRRWSTLLAFPARIAGESAWHTPKGLQVRVTAKAEIIRAMKIPLLPEVPVSDTKEDSAAPKPAEGVTMSSKTVFFPETKAGGSATVRVQVCNTSHVPLVVHFGVVGPSECFSIKRVHRSVSLRPRSFCMLPVTFCPGPHDQSAVGTLTATALAEGEPVESVRHVGMSASAELVGTRSDRERHRSVRSDLSFRLGESAVWKAE
jgi:hypothetical protein